MATINGATLDSSLMGVVVGALSGLTLAGIVVDSSNALVSTSAIAGITANSAVNDVSAFNASTNAVIALNHQGAVNDTSTLGTSINANRDLAGVVLDESKFTLVSIPSQVFECKLSDISTLSASMSSHVLGQGLLVSDVVKDALHLLGLSDCGCGQAASILSRINSALQEIWSHAYKLDDFTKRRVSVQFDVGETSKVLEENIQLTLGDFRLASGEWLREAVSINELYDYVDLYFGGQAPSIPKAVFVDSSHSNTPDNIELTLRIVPEPIKQETVYFDVSIEAPRYTQEDVNNGTAIALPHKYAELLLLPLVRFWAMSHREFRRPELAQAITQQYQTAMMSLGLVMPDSPSREAGTPNPKRLNEQ